MRRRVLLVYHFFHPDEVAGARHFSDLALDLSHSGFDVTALTSNRSYGDPRVQLESHARFGDVVVRRMARPAWSQSRPLQRLANSAWMLTAWTAWCTRQQPYDAVVVGTDPAFGPLLLIPLRRLWPRAVLAQWTFDLYPDAVEADGLGGRVPMLGRLARRLMRRSYAVADLVADLGPCMARRVAAPAEKAITVTPWALVEPDTHRPADGAVRSKMFGAASLGLLYPGTLGRAHDFAPFLQLARQCRAQAGGAIAFCFSGRGHRYAELQAALGPEDTNVRVLGFCSEAELQGRLEAADLHMISLRPQWAGVVVPSKFFGALAVGRPVLYSGPPESDVAIYLRELDVGIALEADGIEATARRLVGLVADRAPLDRWCQRAKAIYRERFARKVIADRWAAALREKLAEPGRGAGSPPAR